MEIIAVGSAENKRIKLFKEAINKRNLTLKNLITYDRIIDNPSLINQFIDKNTIIRFDSPERNFDIQKKIIEVGYNPHNNSKNKQISPKQLNNFPFIKGEIRYPKQFFQGWQKLLKLWGDNLQIKSFNHPYDIAKMFDKTYCNNLFAQNKLPVAQSLGNITCYEELKETMYQQGYQKVFIKLAHGSSGSGVVAYNLGEYNQPESAITTVDIRRRKNDIKLFNSRQIKTYKNKQNIKDIINYLCAEEVQVEEWLPKAKLGDYPFDLRIVVINGEPQHTVVRLGTRGIITNLHLLNKRGNLEDFLNKVHPKQWEKMQETCVKALSLFPNSLYAGVDLLVYPDFKQHAILEINAFGDLLPNLYWQGMDTYTSELVSLQKLYC